MRETVFKNKWLVLLLLAAALALLTRFIGAAQPAPTEPDSAGAPAPASEPSAHSTADTTGQNADEDEEDDDEEDLLDPGTGEDSSGFDPTPDSKTMLDPPLDPNEDKLETEPEDPAGYDPTPED